MKKYCFMFLGLIFPMFVSGNEISAEKIKYGVEYVSLVENLMKEHGVLDRLLLIYEKILEQIELDQKISFYELKRSTEIVKSFIENYHEKLEETYIFPRLEKSKKMVAFVKILKEQHIEGRRLTDYIIDRSTNINLKNLEEKNKLRQVIKDYITMYRPHTAREDTVLFPEFRKLISSPGYEELGRIFKDKEEDLFGKDVYSSIIRDISRIEEELHIHNLSQFSHQNIVR